MTRPELSRRQAEILQRVKQGQPDKAIAHELGISVHTVRTYIERIAAKVPGETPRRHRLFFLNVDGAA
ncbi:MAG: Bacterial regulatory protein luxR family [Gemmatimonadetes bacterium]|nr:Bacterial regulatory protein luxR family [Gemmatimonadota bacterium]